MRLTLEAIGTLAGVEFEAQHDTLHLHAPNAPESAAEKLKQIGWFSDHPTYWQIYT